MSEPVAISDKPQKKMSKDMEMRQLDYFLSLDTHQLDTNFNPAFTELGMLAKQLMEVGVIDHKFFTRYW
jgi:hypothetical protein